jgi:MYND finger
MLTVGEIRARHDFTLLLLLRAWQAPWSPESHASFQPDFREAVKMVAQCTHRLGFPHEVMLAVCSFLNRDWWEDSRKQCWSYECLCEQSSKAVAQKFSGQNAISAAPATLEYCPRCRVAMYCSKDCRDNDYKLGHKKSCCRPPMQSTVPVKEELQLCVEILNDGTTPLPTFLTSRNTAAADLVRQALIVPGNDNGNPGSNLGDSDDDDEGSWETVDSGDEEMEEADVSRITTTARIYKYFKETSYDTKS